MRYSRIFRPLGVVLGAALVVVMGMPGAVQAQEIPEKDGVKYTDAGGFDVTWTHRLAGVKTWQVTATKPNGVEIKESTSDKTVVSFKGHNDLGTWSFQVEARFDEGDPETGASVRYTHGAFPAPMNLGATVVPGGVALTWTAVKDDHGLVDYQYSTDGFDKVTTSAGTAGALVVPDVMPGEQTFSLRARGESDNDLNTLAGDPGDAESIGAVAMATVMVPETVPTLPEILTFVLALTFVGSGVYVLRRKGSTGLTSA